MDTRFTQTALDTGRSEAIFLHPTAEMEDIRNGTATDAFELTPFVSAGTQSFFECSITLNWDQELFGANQPKPYQILEIRSYGLTSWMGIVENISSYKISRGTRQMEVSAKSRDGLPLWRDTKLVTNLYPTLTSLTAIATDIAKKIGMYDDEIVLPTSNVQTAHSNTQIAGLAAWECFTTLFLPMGLTPFIDCIGRLRGASRELASRTPDVILPSDRIIEVNANRVRPPTTRVQVKWLDPNLTKSVQTGRKLADYTVTTGWFIPYIQKEVWFSPDKTQRAENTYIRIRQSANGVGVPVCLELYSQTSQATGEIMLINLAWAPSMVALIYLITHASLIPDLVVTAGLGAQSGHTIPIGKKIEGLAIQVVLLIIMSIGTGVYEIWGDPYDWVHARNTTEAFDQSSPGFVDNPDEVETDFVMNEPHADEIAVRELVYKYNSGNNWDITIVDDPRIEYGDVLEFPDTSRMYVLDCTRKLGRDSDANLQLKGFLIGTPAGATAPPTGVGLYTASGFITGPSDGIAGVTMVLTGAAFATIASDGSGNWTFSNLPTGTYVVTPSLISFTFSPTSSIITITAGNSVGTHFVATKNTITTHNISGTISGGPFARVDVTGGMTAYTFADASGNYVIAGFANGNYTITPSLAGYGITPGFQNETIAGSSITGVNFVATALPSPTRGGGGGGGGGLSPAAQIANDMAGSNEAFPDGVPTSYDFYHGPALEQGNSPAGATALEWWSGIYPDASGNPATNTRVEIRNAQLWYLDSSNVWHKIWDDSMQAIGGGMYSADFTTDLGISLTFHSESDGGVSVIDPTPGTGVSVVPGTVAHEYAPYPRPTFSNLTGVVAYAEARLVLINPLGTDDRASARLLFGVGADYYPAATGAGIEQNPGVGIGKLKLVGTSYRSFAMTTLSEGALAANFPSIDLTGILP